MSAREQYIYHGPSPVVAANKSSGLTYLSSIQVLDEMIKEAAQRANRVASAAGQDWNQDFGMIYNLRIGVLQEVKMALIKKGAQELEKGLSIQ